MEIVRRELEFNPFYILVDVLDVINRDGGLLAEIIRRRIYVASESTFSSLNVLSTPDLRDVELTLGVSKVFQSINCHATSCC